MLPAPAPAAPPAFIASGSADFHRTNLALFAAGFSTFALLYCLQPLMPELARVFHVGAAESSLAISLTTASLALALLVTGSLSEAWGRKPVMAISLLAAAALTVVAAFVPGWHGLLLVRALIGLALSGVPAVAMAYLSEEMHSAAIGLAMGLYISGTGLGGMAGRLLAGVLTEHASWRLAVGVIGGTGILAALVFWRSLPPSRHFQPRPLALRGLLASLGEPFRDAGLPWLFAAGFLVMGSFVTVYNYIAFRLLAPPYRLGQARVGAIFVVYLVGIASSAWMGALAGRRGRRKVFWATVVLMLAGLALTLVTNLAAIVAGLAVLTFGFFGAHSVLSAWVGLRAARQAKAQASSLYLFFYYVGSSIAGWCGGFGWSHAGWPGVAAFVAVLLLIALAIALRLTVLPPKAAATATTTAIATATSTATSL